MKKINTIQSNNKVAYSDLVLREINNQQFDSKISDLSTKNSTSNLSIEYNTYLETKKDVEYRNQFKQLRKDFKNKQINNDYDIPNKKKNLDLNLDSNNLLKIFMKNIYIDKPTINQTFKESNKNIIKDIKLENLNSKQKQGSKHLQDIREKLLQSKTTMHNKKNLNSSLQQKTDKFQKMSKKDYTFDSQKHYGMKDNKALLLCSNKNEFKLPKLLNNMKKLDNINRFKKNDNLFENNNLRKSKSFTDQVIEEN